MRAWLWGTMTNITARPYQACRLVLETKIIISSGHIVASRGDCQEGREEENARDLIKNREVILTPRPESCGRSEAGTQRKTRGGGHRMLDQRACSFVHSSCHPFLYSSSKFTARH